MNPGRALARALVALRREEIQFRERLQTLGTLYRTAKRMHELSTRARHIASTGHLFDHTSEPTFGASVAALVESAEHAGLALANALKTTHSSTHNRDAVDRVAWEVHKAAQLAALVALSNAASIEAELFDQCTHTEGLAEALDLIEHFQAFEDATL